MCYLRGSISLLPVGFTAVSVHIGREKTKVLLCNISNMYDVLRNQSLDLRGTVFNISIVAEN